MPRPAIYAIALLWTALLAGPVAATSQVQSDSPQERDLLNLNSGAVVLSWSSQWDEEWAALLLLDDTPERGWSAGKGTDFPHEILIELGETTRLTRLALDNSGALEADYPGISAREIEVWASTQAPDKGFDQVMTVEAEQGERAEFPLPEPTEVRWLKLKIQSNWGSERYTELMEVDGYGEPLDEAPSRPQLAGVYDTNYELMRFEQTGNQVRGCYDFKGGTLSGTTDGRVVQFEWREDAGQQVGTALMVLSSTGEKLNGLWYHQGEYKGLWLGSPAEAGVQPECTVPASSNLSKSLADTGKAILYGIRFDIGSAQLRPESEATLREGLAALKSQPGLRLTVEGHTDATGPEASNQDLSQRRARAVVAWLVERGIDPERLQARGRGESEPVASNDSAQGRALNRRVELERMR